MHHRPTCCAQAIFILGFVYSFVFVFVFAFAPAAHDVFTRKGDVSRLA